MRDTVFLASREGDLPRLKRLVEEEGRDLNVNDEWDATPLYYAALCGHMPVVRYLLERGARCEPDTFDAERAFYAALTDDIRRVLHAYQAANKQRGPLFVLTFRLFNNPSAGADLLLRTPDGWELAAHAWVLAARSTYFARKLAGPWRGRRRVHLTDPRLSGPALHAVLSWVYTERLLCPSSRLGEVRALARNARLHDLLAFLEGYKCPGGGGGRGGALAGVGEEDDDPASRLVALDLGKPYRVGTVPVPLVHHDAPPSSARHPLPPLLVPITDVRTALLDSTEEEEEERGEEEGGEGGPWAVGAALPSRHAAAVRHSFRSQVWRRVLHCRGGVVPREAFDPAWDEEEDEDDDAMGVGKRDGGTTGCGAKREPLTSDDEEVGTPAASSTVHADLRIVVSGVTFLAHSSIVCARSKCIESLLDFQRAAAGDDSGPGNTLRCVELSEISPPAFAACLEFMYTDAVRPLRPRRVLETLAVADQLLLSEMKAPLVRAAVAGLTTATLCDAWRLGEQLGLQRLSQACARFTAASLDVVLALPDMAALCTESASTILARQEHDSVPVLDEVKAALREAAGYGGRQGRRGGTAGSSERGAGAQHRGGGGGGRGGEEEEEEWGGGSGAPPAQVESWDPATSDRGAHNTFKADDAVANPTGFKSPFDGLVMGEGGAFVYVGSHLPDAYQAGGQGGEGVGVVDPPVRDPVAGQPQQDDELTRGLALVDAFAAGLGLKTRR